MHLLSNASLRTIRADHPDGLFDIHRFRPNLVVEVDGEGFVEERWIGATLAIGTARLRGREADEPVRDDDSPAGRAAT